MRYFFKNPCQIYQNCLKDMFRFPYYFYYFFIIEILSYILVSLLQGPNQKHGRTGEILWKNLDDILEQNCFQQSVEDFS